MSSNPLRNLSNSRRCEHGSSSKSHRWSTRRYGPSGSHAVRRVPQTRELLLALHQERQRQQMTLAQLAQRTGYDPAVLSRLFTGRQTNTTLATLARIANALGKEVVHTLRELPVCSGATGRGNKGKSAIRAKLAAEGSVERITARRNKSAKKIGGH